MLIFYFLAIVSRNLFDNADCLTYNIKVIARRECAAVKLHVAAMAQQVEHVLGKDEVTSSNLVSSSIHYKGTGI